MAFFFSEVAHSLYTLTLMPDHQKSVARSSTKVEYRSIANTSSELTWINFLLQELGIHQLKAPVIYCDSVGATYLCVNSVFSLSYETFGVGLSFHTKSGTVGSS